MQTTTDTDTDNPNKSDATKSKRGPKETGKKKTYTEIRVTLEKQNTSGSQERPQGKSRKERRLQNTQKSKNSNRHGKRHRKQNSTNK